MVTTSGVTAADAAGAKLSASKRAQLSRDQFMQILVKELSSQDPLQPVDNSQFIQQLVSLQSLQESASLTDSLQSFQRFMEMSSGSALIGKVVKGISDSGSSVTGRVSKVVMEKDKVSLVIGSDKVPVSGVQEILSQ